MFLLKIRKKPEMKILTDVLLVFTPKYFFLFSGFFQIEVGFLNIKKVQLKSWKIGKLCLSACSKSVID